MSSFFNWRQMMQSRRRQFPRGESSGRRMLSITSISTRRVRRVRGQAGEEVGVWATSSRVTHIKAGDGAVCCVYHKPRAFGESSSESASSDMSDDYETRMRKIRMRRKKAIEAARRKHAEEGAHVHGEECMHGDESGGGGHGHDDNDGLGDARHGSDAISGDGAASSMPHP